ALALMAKAFKLNYSTPTNNNQRISSNLRNRQIAQPGMNMGQDKQMQMIGGNGGNQFRQYAGQNARNLNRGVGHFARDCTVKPRRRDAAYLQTQLLIAQKEETDSTLVYDSDGSAKVHEHCDNNEIFNMFTQEEQYTELLEPIPEPQQVPQNDNNVISEVTDVEQVGKTVEQHSANFEETPPHQDQSPYNQNFLQQPMTNPEDITDPTTAMNMALALMAKAFKLNYSTPTNNNQRISSNPRNRQIAQPGMNMGQDRQMQMIGGNGGNQFRQYAGQNAGNLNGYNEIAQNLRVQNVGNQNGLIGVQGNGIQNQIGNRNLVAARAEGNVAGQNANQIRCYNYRGFGHYARNCTARPRRRDAAYLQTQLLIAQKEEAGIQLQAEEYDLMVAAADLDEIKEVNANCILMANLQQASSSGTQTDSAPVYDSNGSAEVHEYENCYNNEIFNMFTQEEQYTELLEPIPESLQVPHNDNEVISEVTGVVQGRETVEHHPANFEETRALYESLYENLAIKVEKVNSVNHKLKETNADLTTELARYKNQERCFEISQEKYDKLEKCYQQSVYQEKCLSKKINALHLSTGKQIMTLNEQISDLNKQLSKEKSTVSFLLEEKKKLKSDFKTCEDKLLDKQIELEKKIKDLNNIVFKTGQSIQTINMLSPKPDSFYHTEQKMASGCQNPFYLKQAQKKQQNTATCSRESSKDENYEKEIKPANYTKINHLSGVFVPQTALSREELYFSNISKMANVSKSISIPNEDLSDDTTPSVALVSQDIISIVQIASVVDTSDLQTELERTKEHFENYIIKKETKYAKLWNAWYKKYDECKYDKILYDKAYKDMQQKIERLQAQLRDLKGKSTDTACVSETQNQLFKKLENANVELEFQ
nr:hypothetical protein [Tanacetum cinerariifolium]